MIGYYYHVYVTTWPFSSDMQQSVGDYTNSQTAMRVLEFIRDLSMHQYPGGIDMDFQKCEAKFLKCPDELKWEDIPVCFTRILDEVDHKEYNRLSNLKFRYREIEHIDL